MQNLTDQQRLANMFNTSFSDILSVWNTGWPKRKSVVEPPTEQENKNQNMRFKKFERAYTGDLVDLLNFERKLLALGYTSSKPTLFNTARTEQPNFKFYITLGVHYDAYEPGMFTAAKNSGDVPQENVIVVTEDNIQKLLKELEPIKPLVVTQDGVAKYLGDSVFYIRKDWSYHHWKKITNSINGDTAKFFDKEENCVEYIRQNKPLGINVIQLEAIIREAFAQNNIPVDHVVLTIPTDFIKKGE